MIRRIVIPPYDSFGVATLVVNDSTVFTGHFGGLSGPDGHRLLGIEAQTRQCFANLDSALHEIGLSVKDLLKVTVILRNISDFHAMHEVWKSIFPSDYPARTTITSDFVDADCLIQIEGIAAINNQA